jgi:hypothetical protein
MPFNTSSWVYTPAAGATSASPGQLIQSAIWDGIFTDLSAALNQLGSLRVTTKVYQTAGVTTYTPSPNLVFAVVEAQGGGGGGGGATGAAGGIASGGGGAGGGFAYAVIPVSSIGVTVGITVGATGAGGGAGNTAGVTGGTSSFGGFVVAAGGNPGGGAAATVAASGGLGGVGVTGQIMRTGDDGRMGIAAAITTVRGPSGEGGSRPWPVSTTPGVVAVTSAVTGNAGDIASGGSGGQAHGTAGNAAGGVGGTGQIFVWEYCF